MAVAPVLPRPPPASGRVRSQKFIGTLFPFENDNPLYCAWVPLHPEAFRCAVWSHEIAPSTGKHHIQFYGETKQACSYAQLAGHCGLGPNQCHWEQAQHPQEAWDYCSDAKPDPESRHGCAQGSIGERPVGGNHNNSIGIITITQSEQSEEEGAISPRFSENSESDHSQNSSISSQNSFSSTHQESAGLTSSSPPRATPLKSGSRKRSTSSTAKEERVRTGSSGKSAKVDAHCPACGYCTMYSGF